MAQLLLGITPSNSKTKLVNGIMARHKLGPKHNGFFKDALPRIGPTSKADNQTRGEASLPPGGNACRGCPHTSDGEQLSWGNSRHLMSPGALGVSSAGKEFSGRSSDSSNTRNSGSAKGSFGFTFFGKGQISRDTRSEHDPNVPGGLDTLHTYAISGQFTSNTNSKLPATRNDDE